MDSAPFAAFRDWAVIDTNIEEGSEMEPRTWQPSNSSPASTNGIGQYLAGSNASGGAATRGGDHSSGFIIAGIYVLSLGLYSTDAGVPYGFRCSYAPD